MKINNLKINGFGKLNNKEIDFSSENINIIYGENESGKSTLLKYILCVLYGISKNKNGKSISDLEKYEPWDVRDYSGKIEYQLDDKTRYAVFRDFRKKNPEIYDENLKEISSEFRIDKIQGNMFFTEQVGINESTFSSIIVSKQDEVKLDSKMQSNLVQKMANLVGTGDDNVSYNKIITKLNKRLIEEVGTSKSKDRPININMQKKAKLEEEKKKLVNISEEKYNLEECIQEAENELQYEKLRLDIAKKIKILKDKEYFEKEKIKLNRDVDEDYDIEIDDLEEKLQDLKIEKQKNKMLNPILIFILCIILGIVGKIILNNFLLYIGIIIASTIVFVLYFVKYLLVKRKINNNYLDNKYKSEQIKNRIEQIKKNQIAKNKNLETLENKTFNELNYEKEKIRNKYLEDIEENEINRLFLEDNIEEKIDEIQNNINEKKYCLNDLELRRKMLIPKLDRLVNIEEELKELTEEYDNLIYIEKCIMLSKEMMSISYEEMKNCVTPCFTRNLSKNISKISNNKYNVVHFDDDKGLTVGLENGSFVSAEKLSIGTIDQLYLSLRLATANELTNEKLPIILDETFAFCDEKRLNNILKYLSLEFNDRQIIIFTCTDREKKVCDSLNIKYNLVCM